MTIFQNTETITDLIKSFWFIFATAEVATTIATKHAATTKKETATCRKSTNDERPLQKTQQIYLLTYGFIILIIASR